MEIVIPDFIQIPTQLLSDNNLRPTDRILYGFIYWYTKLKLERCIASNETLAKQVGCTEGSLANSLSRLSKNGYVKVKMNGRIRVEIIPLVTYARLTSSNDDVTSSNDVFTSSNDEHNKNIKKNRKKEGTKKNKFSSMYDISDDVCKELAKEYQVREKAVLDLREDMILYCKRTGKRYKNYKAVMQTWIRNAIKRKDIQKETPRQEMPNIPEMSPEEHQKAIKEAQKIREKLANGFAMKGSI